MNLWIILGIFGLLWVGMGGFFMWRMLTYKHDFILKRPGGKSFVALRTRAREIKEKDGTTMWKLLKYKKEPVPVPPDSALNFNKKGKFYVEGWLLEDGQVQYESHPTVAGVDISTSNQKILLANQIRTAEEKRFKGWKEMLPTIIIPVATLFILAMVVVMGMIFWQDITQPGLEAKQLTLQEHELMKENLNLLREIKQDIQVIDEVKQNTAVNRDPPD